MRSRALPIALGLAALALLTIFCVQRHAKQIQDDIQTRATAALRAAGIDWADARSNGRTVVLIGNAPDAASRKLAGETVAAIDGAGAVENMLQLAQPAPAAITTSPEASEPYSLSFNYRAGILSLDGSVPSEEDHDAIIKVARARFGENQIVDRLRLRPDAPPRFIVAVQNTVLNSLPGFAEAFGKVSDSTIYLTGKVREQADATRLEALVSMSVPRDFTLQFKAETVTNAPVEGYLTTADKSAIADCQTRFNTLLASQSIRFDNADAEITPESHKLLGQLADLVNQCQDMRIEIAGHTDNRGKRERNKALSEARAAAVRDYLISKGVPGARLVARGYGAEKPLADNRTEKGRARNRRIEFNIEGG